jgi:hypothetical protein
MAERLSLQFRRLLEERKLQRIQAKKDVVLKEIASAEYDLEKSKNSFEEEDYKWTIVQAYYSMFHAARALIYSKVPREKPSGMLHRSERVLSRYSWRRANQRLWGSHGLTGVSGLRLRIHRRGCKNLDRES